MPILAWNTPPAPAELARVIETHPAPLHLVACLSENRMPNFPLSDAPTELEGRLKTRLDQAVKCLQFNSVNFLENLLPDVHIWPAAPRRQPVRTFRPYRMADRSRTASRAQARQTLVQTTSSHHPARKRAGYRRGHCRSSDRA